MKDNWITEVKKSAGFLHFMQEAGTVCHYSL